MSVLHFKTHRLSFTQEFNLVRLQNSVFSYNNRFVFYNPRRLGQTLILARSKDYHHLNRALWRFRSPEARQKKKKIQFLDLSYHHTQGTRGLTRTWRRWHRKHEVCPPKSRRRHEASAGPTHKDTSKQLPILETNFVRVALFRSGTSVIHREKWECCGGMKTERESWDVYVWGFALRNTHGLLSISLRQWVKDEFPSSPPPPDASHHQPHVKPLLRSIVNR